MLSALHKAGIVDHDISNSDCDDLVLNALRAGKIWPLHLCSTSSAKATNSCTPVILILNSPGRERHLVAGVVGRLGVDGVAPGLGRGGISLHSTAAISAEVVHVGGVGPLGVDGSIVVESALLNYRYQQIGNDIREGKDLTTPLVKPTTWSKLS